MSGGPGLKCRGVRGQGEDYKEQGIETKARPAEGIPEEKMSYTKACTNM